MELVQAPDLIRVVMIVAVDVKAFVIAGSIVLGDLETGRWVGGRRA
jgi:hypothetical protein